VDPFPLSDGQGVIYLDKRGSQFVPVESEQLAHGRRYGKKKFHGDRSFSMRVQQINAGYSCYGNQRKTDTQDQIKENKETSNQIMQIKLYMVVGENPLIY
jgi:hypothetical protein